MAEHDINSPVPSDHGDASNTSNTNCDDDEASSMSTEHSTSREICTIIFNGLKKAKDENQSIPNVKEILEEELKDLQNLRTKYDKNSINAELDGIVNLHKRELFHQIYKELRNQILTQLSKLASTSNDEKELKLPKLNVPKFNGSPGDWITFRNIFTTIIHNSNISDIKKNSYLHSYLEGDALDLIKNLEISENTYEESWRIINLHYYDPFLQVAEHLNAIINQPTMEKKAPLRTIIRNFRQNFAAFQSIVKEHKLDAISQILIALFTSKINKDVRCEWEKEISAKGKFYSFEEFLRFMEAQSNAIQRSNPAQSRPEAGTPIRKGVALSAISTTEKTMYCAYCNQKTDHLIHKCPAFLKLESSARNSIVRKQRLCARCLRRTCNTSCSKFTCRICRKQHNTLIHCNRPTNAVNINENESRTLNGEPPGKITKLNPSESYNSYLPLTKPKSLPLPILVLQTFGALSILNSLLATATVRIKGIEVKALLDSGSQYNFISKRLQSKLQLPELCTQHHNVQGIGGIFVQKLMSVTSTVIESIHSSFKIQLPCLVIDKIIDYIPNDYFSIESWNIPKTIKLADPTFNIPSNVDILIGSNTFWEILGNNKIILNKNLPQLRDTRLGWIVSGEINTNASQGICSLTYNENLEICRLVEKFWEIENGQTEKRQWSEEERMCEHLFLKTTKRLPDGRFIVHLPFKENPSILGESRNLALKRFYYLEKKLQLNEKLREMYTNCLEEYITLGHMTEVTITSDQNVYYIPHHAVFKEDSTTTKLRTVFDASMKASNNKSLNDILMVGPVVQSLLIAILLRFRTYKYVFTADITKMYQQIR